MKKQKADFISESEFTKMNTQKVKHHYPLPSEVIPEDENADQLKETLIGMEYDVESNEEINSSYEEAINDEESEIAESLEPQIDHHKLNKKQVTKQQLKILDR